MSDDDFRTPYAGYDVLRKWTTPSWNAVTRQVVGRRLVTRPPRRFLSEREFAVLEAACDRVLPQPDRAEPVPIAGWIDETLHAGRSDGTRLASMPPLREAWRQALAALDAECEARTGRGFVEASDADRDSVLAAVAAGTVRSAAWQGLSPETFFTAYLMKSVTAIYYAHPAAWNEVGFGGPASPRGYARIQPDRIDPWEARKRP